MVNEEISPGSDPRRHLRSVSSGVFLIALIFGVLVVSQYTPPDLLTQIALSSPESLGSVSAAGNAHRQFVHSAGILRSDIDASIRVSILGVRGAIRNIDSWPTKQLFSLVTVFASPTPLLFVFEIAPNLRSFRKSPYVALVL